MSRSASVSAVEGALTSDEERLLRVRQNLVYLADAIAAVDKIESHLAGTQEALEAKRNEVEWLRATLREDGGI